MLSARQQHCLHGIGIRQWCERDGVNESSRTGEFAAEPQIVADSPVDMPKVQDFATRLSEEILSPGAPLIEPGAAVALENPPTTIAQLDSWDGIISAIDACTACDLARNCNQKVPGVGQRQANLLIVGEGPGRDEDLSGEPFVGRSGKLLDRMLAAIGIERAQIYITNIVKCRPPNNRDPNLEEAQQCRPYLEAQIRQLAPKVILCLGRVSAHNLLNTKLPVGKLIQQIHQLPGTEIPVKVSYHPAYLLRNPSAKAISWQDLKQVHLMLQ